MGMVGAAHRPQERWRKRNFVKGCASDVKYRSSGFGRRLSARNDLNCACLTQGSAAPGAGRTTTRTGTANVGCKQSRWLAGRCFDGYRKKAVDSKDRGQRRRGAYNEVERREEKHAKLDPVRCSRFAGRSAPPAASWAAEASVSARREK